jgi:hypothetical protein
MRRAEQRPVRPEDGIAAQAETGSVTPIMMAAQREGSHQHRPRSGENEPRVVGFGDDLPAFLRRPVRIAGA